MTGIAAIALCAAFTSCSHDLDSLSPEELENLEAQKAFSKYENAFIATFGEPAADQEWGFGAMTASVRNVTRGLSDKTAGANKNRNQWAAYDDIYNVEVPTPLSAGQKLRVKAYFQTHRFLTWETPDMTNYFIQQVYTGHTAVGTGSIASLSAEQYTQGNNTPVIGAEHMDQLTIGSGNVHVYDFNGADNVNTATDVLNNGEDKNSKNFHSDQITLMIGTTPTCVGYQSSDGTIQHNDCCALVSAKVIDDWAAENGNIGDPVWYDYDEDGYLNSHWNRSFVGLDYEQRPLEAIYAKKNVYENGQTIALDYARKLDFCSDPINTKWVKYQNNYVDISTITNDNILDPAGNPVHWIADQTNEYLGNNLGTTQNTFNKQATINGVADTKYYDLDAVYSYINQGALPKVNNMEFIKDLGGRDYVFSDWIVTLSPAHEFTPSGNDDPYPNATSLRVMAEDLSATEKSDFDFNDVVFDVVRIDDTHADIILQAAGGTLPLRINSTNGVGGWEVHDAFDVAQNVMVNTNAQAKNLTGETRNPVYLTKMTGYAPIEGDFTAANFCQTVRDIRVEVQKSGVWMPLEAKRGVACCKFGTDPRNKWVPERENIDDYYDFSKWVKGFTTTLTATKTW